MSALRLIGTWVLTIGLSTAMTAAAGAATAISSAEDFFVTSSEGRLRLASLAVTILGIATASLLVLEGDRPSRSDPASLGEPSPVQLSLEMRGTLPP